MQGGPNYLVDLTKGKSKTEQRRNTENLSDEVFSDLVFDVMCAIAEGFQEDMLKMDILWLIYTTK